MEDQKKMPETEIEHEEKTTPEEMGGYTVENDYTTYIPYDKIAQKRIEENLPRYSDKEEKMNAITHIVGGGLGIIGLIVGVVYAAIYKGSSAAWIMAIFGLSMVTLYTVSSVYHALHVNKAKKVFQIIDHCTIYLLIAGTYTPISLIVLANDTPWNFVLLGVVYALAVLGIVLNATMMDKKPVKVISQILYLLTGWAVILFYPVLVQNIGMVGVWLLVGGGICYTLGAIIYGIGKKIPYFHSVFHIFVILGTVMQYLSILLFGVIGL